MPQPPDPDAPIRRSDRIEAVRDSFEAAAGLHGYVLDTDFALRSAAGSSSLGRLPPLAALKLVGAACLMVLGAR
jgi:hypothetical protein